MIKMMKTGIVRKIDDLGRVVIPKEIRKSMNIKEGDLLEIFIYYGGEVIFRKYETEEDEKNETLQDFNQPMEMPTNPKPKSKRKDYELRIGDYKYLLHLTENEAKLMDWLEAQGLIEPDEFEEVGQNYDAEYGRASE